MFLRHLWYCSMVDGPLTKRNSPVAVAVAVGVVTRSSSMLSTSINKPFPALLFVTALVDWCWGCYLPPSTSTDVMDGNPNFCTAGCMLQNQRESTSVETVLKLLATNSVAEIVAPARSRPETDNCT